MQRTQTTEENEVRTTERPSCWQEPEEETYWWLELRDGDPDGDGPDGVLLFMSEGEAMLAALQDGNVGAIAEECTLGMALESAREEGASGVRIVCYRNGGWVTFRDVPL